jgi:hypothetical protein
MERLGRAGLVLWLCKKSLRQQCCSADEATDDLQLLVHGTADTWKVPCQRGCGVEPHPRHGMLLSKAQCARLTVQWRVCEAFGRAPRIPERWGHELRSARTPLDPRQEAHRTSRDSICSAVSGGASSTSGLTLELSGGRKHAKRACVRPLE